jgi:peptidoglycan DL-endopeptidase CwlO
LIVATLAIAITGAGTTAAHAAPSKSELTKQIDALSNQLEDITESYNKKNIDLQKTVSDEKSLAASLGPAKDALKVATAQMQTIAATYYKTGQVGAMNVLFEGDGGATDMLDRMSVIDQMSKSRERDIANFTATAQNYDSRQAALKTTQAKQTAEANALAKSKADIEAKIKVLLAKRKAAYGQAQETGSKYTGPIPSISGAAGKAVTFAYNHIGDAYVYATAGPNTFDCSGLTMAAWAAAGKSLPHNAAEQYSATARISKADLKEGDLVFYRGLGHVGLYVGGGMIIDAPHTGTTVGKRSMMVMTPYGYGRFPAGNRPSSMYRVELRRPADPRPGPAHAAGRAPGSRADGSAPGRARTARRPR